MDSVSHYRNCEDIDAETGDGAVADLNAHLGDLQMGGAGKMLIDEYDPVDEKPDAAVINPDDPSDGPESETLADDCEL